MTKWVPRVAMSGFICCLLYFISGIAELFFSGAGILSPEMVLHGREYQSWLSSSARTILIIAENVLFPAIWIIVLFFLVKFKERLFIVLAVIFYILWATYTTYFHPHFAWFNINMIITGADILFLVVSFWFVKHPYLKGFTRLFTLAIFARALVTPLSGWLYDEFFQSRWLLINPLIPSLLPYSILTVMFLSIWVRSRNVYAPIE